MGSRGTLPERMATDTTDVDLIPDSDSKLSQGTVAAKLTIRASAPN